MVVCSMCSCIRVAWWIPLPLFSSDSTMGTFWSKDQLFLKDYFVAVGSVYEKAGGTIPPSVQDELQAAAQQKEMLQLDHLTQCRRIELGK